MTDKKKITLFVVLLLAFTMCLCDSVWAASPPNVLLTLGGRTETFARQLRSFAFIISGFGIIMFTWAAVFGKINFRHLGYIMISLFFLSGVGLFISYITGGDSNVITFTNLYDDSLAINNAAGQSSGYSTSL